MLVVALIALVGAFMQRLKLCSLHPFLNFSERAHSLNPPCHGFLRIASTPTCLKQDHAGKVSTYAQQTDHDGTDPETVDWVNNAVHDPMVEVDPVTVNNQILAQKQSRILQESTSVADNSLPTFHQNTKRLSSATIASFTAPILFIAALTLLVLKFRERFERLQRKLGASSIISSAEPSKAKREVVKGTFKASPDAVPVTATRKAEVIALGTLLSNNIQNHKNSHKLEDAITIPRPYFKGSVVESEGHNAMIQLSTNTQVQLMKKPSLKQKVPTTPESKDFTDTAPHKGHNDEVDAMGGRGLKQFMDQNLSPMPAVLADSGVVLEEASLQTLVKAGQSYSRKHTSDSIHQQTQVMTEKAPVKLALQDSFDCLPSSSGLHSAANSSREPIAHSWSCSSETPTSTQGLVQTKQLSIASKSEITAPGSPEKQIKKISKGNRKAFNKALEAALPAVAIGVGTLGTLLGAGGALQVIGFAATAKLISRDLFWAQTREELWQELSGITNRQKLLDFLMKRNIVKKIN